MTRFLSESLQAREPNFRLQLQELERANGCPNADIRLSSDIAQGLRRKIAALGLDPSDTTAEELYGALHAKLTRDECRLVRSLQTLAATHVSAEADVIAGLVHALRGMKRGRKGFVLKSTRFKALIKKQPPKHVMKRLGYRSLDSLLRHEVPALILCAAQTLESDAWWRSLRQQYKSLQAVDFEFRTQTILYPDKKNWLTLSHSIVKQTKHNIFKFNELGALVVLPLPLDAPEGTVIAAALIALRSLSELGSAASYLQLCQVRPDFGVHVQGVANGEPLLTTHLLDYSLPWHLIERSFATLEHVVAGTLEPYVEFETSSWRSMTQALQRLEPGLGFWRDSEHLALLHKGRAVSLNPLDVALNLCNKVSFENRIVHYFQQSLWHELLLRYLHPQVVQQTISTALNSEVAPAFALQ